MPQLDGILLKNNKSNSSPDPPKAVVSRMSLYLRELEQLLADGKKTISSTKLARLLGITDAQVRKDFAYFGQFGYPGIGYRCHELAEEIKRIMGTNRVWPVVLVGCGNLGRALLGHDGFQSKGFQIVAAFDVAPSIVGQVVEGIQIQHLDSLTREFCQTHEIHMGVLAIPAEAAEKVAEHLVQAGISGILNFAPVTLNFPKSVTIAGVDLAIELEQLSFAVVKQLGKQ